MIKDIEQAIEIEAIRCFRRIIRAQELARFRGAEPSRLISIANLEIAQAKRDFDCHTTAALPAQRLHARIIKMLEVQ
jgi:tRNA A37 N6-isopentenylltransferase MiaA